MTEVTSHEASLSWLSFLAPAAIFLATLPVDVGPEGTVHWILIAHRLDVATPGTPLYALLGKLFTNLFPFPTLAMRVHALSAIAMAGYCWLISRILRPMTGPIAAFFAALVAATGVTAWSLGTHANPISVVLMFLGAQYLLTQDILGFPRRQRFVALCLLSALALSVHPAALAGLPWIVQAARASRRTPYLAGLNVFLLGLTLFIYWPLRAQHPVAQGALASSAASPRLFDPITAATVVLHVRASLDQVVRDHHPLLLFFAIPGLYALVRRQRSWILGIPALGLAALLASLLVPAPAPPAFLQFFLLGPLFSVACGLTLAWGLTRRHRWIGKLMILWAISAISANVLRNRVYFADVVPSASYRTARALQLAAGAEGTLVVLGEELLPVLDYLRLVEEHLPRQEVFIVPSPMVPIEVTTSGNSHVVFDFEPKDVPPGYRVAARGSFFTLVPAPRRRTPAHP